MNPNQDTDNEPNVLINLELEELDNSSSTNSKADDQDLHELDTMSDTFETAMIQDHFTINENCINKFCCYATDAKPLIVKDFESEMFVCEKCTCPRCGGRLIICEMCRNSNYHSIHSEYIISETLSHILSL